MFGLFRVSFLLLFALLLTMHAGAQDLSNRVLIVYNANSQNSLITGGYYGAFRGIPPWNFCAITPPSTDVLSPADFEATVRAPVQACLNFIGPQNILYIVMAFDTPYRIDRDGPFSLDSWLADIWYLYPENRSHQGPALTHGYYADSQPQGNFYQPFVSFADYRASNPGDLIYSVWRLDAATPSLAWGLLDQALAAESAGGPAGNACFDTRSGELAGTPDWSYLGGDWDLHKAAEFAAQSGLPVIEDKNNEEFGTSPAPSCPNSALYSGWYSFANYNDAFSWQTGSIGFHLDSLSAGSPRSGPSWSANALQRGIAVTSGAVDEPFLEGLPRPGGTVRNLLEGANVGDAFLRNTRWIKWMILNIGDPLYRPYAGGRPPFSSGAPIDSFELQPKQLYGGGSAIAVIRLSSPAPPEGLQITLTSTVPDLVSVPQSVSVEPGSFSAGFIVSTSVVSVPAGIVVNANTGATTLQNTIELYPLPKEEAAAAARRSRSSDSPMRLSPLK